MPVYYVTSYFIKPEKSVEYQKWLNSPEYRRIAKKYEKETGFKYLNTYFPIFGLGEYDCEDWFMAPDWAAFDKARTSKAMEEWTAKGWDFWDMTRSGKSRVMRTAQDVKTFGPPKKK